MLPCFFSPQLLFLFSLLHYQLKLQEEFPSILFRFRHQKHLKKPNVTSHIFISHCVSQSSIHYTWFMCLHLHARCGCLVTPSWVSADQHSCPRVPVSLTDTQLSHLSGPNHPRVAAGIFSPGPGSAPRSTPVHSSALWRVRSAVTDHERREE